MLDDIKNNIKNVLIKFPNHISKSDKQKINFFKELKIA